MTVLIAWLKVSWGIGAGRNGGQGGLPSGVRLDKPQPFLGNSEDPAIQEAFL